MSYSYLKKLWNETGIGAIIILLLIAYGVGVFGNYNITVKKNMKLKYPNEPNSPSYQGTFIFGVDLVNEIAGDLDEF